MATATQQTDQKKQLTPVQLLRNQLASPAMKSQVEAALPSHVSAEKFVRTTITVVNQNPGLLDCNRDSLFAAIFQSAALGLLPESFMGEAYFIPYKKQVTLQIGYKGLLKLARNTGEIASIESGICHQNDEWNYVEGDQGEFWVKPNILGDRGEPLFAWCVIRLKSGESQREIVSKDEIEKIRKASNSANSPAWKEHWGAMARKVVIKRALKYAPSSTELMQATAIDDAPDSGAQVTVDHGELQVALPAPEPVVPTGNKKASSKEVDELADRLSEHVEEAETVEVTTDGEPEAASFHGQEADRLAEGAA